MATTTEGIVNIVRGFVEAESKKPESRYGYEPFEFHFKPMVEYARTLAKKFDADEEVVVLASWLHDIGAIIEGRKDHHLSGAKIARKKLEEFGYPKEKIDLVIKCVLNHRGSKENKRESIEEKIVAEADTMSNFDNISGIFKAAFVYENLNQKEAQESVRNKLERKWRKLHFKESRKIIKPKYEAAMELLK